MNQDAINWLTVHLLPFEPELRRKLRRVCGSAADVDDVIQEVYCKVMQMDEFAHVADPQGYLVRMAKNFVTDRLRRDAVVSIEVMANLDELGVQDGRPGPERVALGRSELDWVMALIGQLPERCREVFRARRIYGLSQKEAADSLGMTEKAIEYETAKGIELISDMMKRQDVCALASTAKVKKMKRLRGHHVGD